MSRYTAVTPDDLDAMLAAIGVASVDELFDQIPDGVRLREQLDLPAGHARAGRLRRTCSTSRAATPRAEDEITFLGAGMYDHYVPAVIDMLLGRSEFLTPYTPYQPEISQGGLQVMFEYQTAICELTGLPVSNASVYEGPSAVGAAGYLAKLANGKPQARRLARPAPAQPRDAAHALARLRHRGRRGPAAAAASPTPRRWAAAIDDDTCAVFFQQPNVLGAVEDVAALAAAAKDSPAVVVGSYDPLPLGILATPAECGVDVAVGEGQTLGNRLDFGGPSFGFFAATEAYLRRMPGRIAGETTRRRRPPRLRADAADARAAHPPREGDLEHLHLAGAQRARRRRLPQLARARRHRRARRAAAPAHRLRARDARRASTASSCCTSSPSCASSRCGSTSTGSRRAARDRALPGRGRQPRLRARPRLRGASPTACSSRSPSSARASTSTGSPRCSARAVAAERAAGAGRRSRHDRVDDAACTPTRASRPRPAPRRPVGGEARRRCSASARRRSSRRAPPGAARSPARGAACPSATVTSCCPRACAAARRRACRRSPSRSWCATTCASAAATSTSTRASTRSARAR